MRALYIIGAGALVLAVWKGEEAASMAQVEINRATGGSWKTPLAGMKYDEAFRMAEQYYNLPDGLLSRMAYQESRYNPKAFNKKSGAMGLMQFMPVFRDGNGGYGIPAFDPYDPFMAISMAGKLMAAHYRNFGNWQEALAAYNWGPGNVQRKGLASAPLETRNYIAQISADLGGLA
ncbi:MAG: lytic transglycosylase domain-containing protein [Coriobacteriia bacterium]